MQALVRSKAQRGSAAFIVASLLGVGFLPLFGGPGYEQSLAAGLLVPSAAAVATALDVSLDDPPPPLAAVVRGIESGLALGGLAFATALVHSLRVGMCDFIGGATGFALTALAGAVLGGVWGALVGEVARGGSRRRAVAFVLGIGLPLASALVSVVRFYTSPMIFAFDPFVGYFSGTLYDTVIDTGWALVTYRLGSLASLLAVVFAASAVGRRGGHLRLIRQGPGAGRLPFFRLGVATVALLASVAVTVSGPSLGHWETSSTIARELGGERSGLRCDVVYPETLLGDEAALLVKDCDEQLAAVERTLGARGPARVRAFFFRDSGEKKRLMGAADTLIAKPWRQEVYVQLSSYPHPVLGHELAHVVAGTFGRGPFRIAGAAGGLWPDPGLIEGVAVAASPDDDELSDTQWVHAMLDLGSVPPLRRVFSLGFLGVAASKSYTLAGSFVRFVLDTYGAEVVRAWYGGASIEQRTGLSWDELDANFRRWALATPLAPEAQSFARARFERPAVFGRTCPHVVDALRRKADLCRDAHEAEKATAVYEEVLARDPHDWGARYGLGVVNLRYGDPAVGERAVRALAFGEDVPRTWQDRARDALGDDAWLHGQDVAARGAYEALATQSLDEDFARTLEVKSLALREPEGRAAVLALLIGGPGKPSDGIVAATRLGAWEARTKSPLAAYLVGRARVGRGWFTDAVPELDAAIAGATELTPRIAREAVRQRAIVACAVGDGAARDRLRSSLDDPGSPFATSRGRREAVGRLLDRCSVGAVPSL